VPVGPVEGAVGSDVGPLGLVGGPHRRPHDVEVDALSLMTRELARTNTRSSVRYRQIERDLVEQRTFGSRMVYLRYRRV
jgi:hypothetical protein